MKNEKGMALVMVTFTVALIAAFMASFISAVNSRAVLIDTYESVAQARYAAEAGLEEIKNCIRTSAYNNSGNVWLNSNSSVDGFLAIDDLMIGNITVDVTITGLADEWHRVLATAQTGLFNSSVSFEVRGRDSFSRYMFFTHQDNINMGATTVHGDVHSNRMVNFYYGGAKMYDDVTAVRGIRYYSGASPRNTDFYGEVNGYANQVPWPNTSEIATLHNEASGVYKISNSSSEYSGLGNFDTEIEFLGNQVKITIKQELQYRRERVQSGYYWTWRRVRQGNRWVYKRVKVPRYVWRQVQVGGGIVKENTYPLPENNLIFVQGPVTSLKGDINGRVTIATMDKVAITGKLRYVDNEGDRAYVLKQNGNTIEDTREGVVWNEANGYTYESNGDYDPGVPSALGIMSLKDVTIASSAPYNMEFHASVFSSQGNWHCDLAQRKGNLRVLGSMTHKLRGWRYSGSGYGWAKSGEYIYDSNLLASPPAHYLQVNSPLFGAWSRD